MHCVVCLEPEVPEAEKVYLGCCGIHEYHALCLAELFIASGQHAKCPLCRQPLLYVQHDKGDRSDPFPIARLKSYSLSEDDHSITIILRDAITTHH
jgi:uncharacterized protein YbaR (Trm112 family)